jgi:hypothetical protein
MPGGIGKVSETMVSACCRQDRAIASVKNANEIFFNLDARRVFYDGSERYLYFVDSPQNLVMRTIQAVLAGMREPLLIEQLHLDTHKFFNGARRVGLTGAQAHAVLTALRLAGVAATIR